MTPLTASFHKTKRTTVRATKLRRNKQEKITLAAKKQHCPVRATLFQIHPWQVDSNKCSPRTRIQTTERQKTTPGSPKLNAHTHTHFCRLSKTYPHEPNSSHSFENVPAADDSCATRRNRFMPDQIRPDTTTTATLLYTPTAVKPALLDRLAALGGVGGGRLLHPFIFSLVTQCLNRKKVCRRHLHSQPGELSVTVRSQFTTTHKKSTSKL